MDPDSLSLLSQHGGEIVRRLSNDIATRQDHSSEEQQEVY